MLKKHLNLVAKHNYMQRKINKVTVTAIALNEKLEDLG